MNKYLRLIKKMVKGESIVTVRQEQEEWDNQFKKGKWRNSEESGQNVGIIARAVIRESQRRPIRILDVGCGSGVLGQHIAHIPNISYFGYDISKEALKIATQRVPQAVFRQIDIDGSLPHEEYFDIIIFAEVLYYCEYRKIIVSYRSLLAKRGFIIISLYQTWRTRLIWYHLRKMVSVSEDIYLKDIYRNISWRVRTCVYTNSK